jgi:hypothetical protein
VTARRRWGFPPAPAAALAFLLAAPGCSPALAEPARDAGVLLDEVALPPGTVITAPDAGAVRLFDTRYLLHRTVVEQCVEDGERVPELESQLADTAAALQRERADRASSTWLTAAKWSGVAVLVSVAFAAGVLVTR